MELAADALLPLLLAHPADFQASLGVCRYSGFQGLLPLLCGHGLIPGPSMSLFFRGLVSQGSRIPSALQVVQM